MIEMVKAPKYVHDVSDDVPWQPERFQEGSMIAHAYCICDGCDRCGADAGMQWKGYRNQKTLIFWRDELGGMGGQSHVAAENIREHRRMFKVKFYVANR